MMQLTVFSHLWRRNVGVASAFWGACLALVADEVTVGLHLVVGLLFFLSIPALVGLLTWVNRGIVFDRSPRHPLSVLVLGAAVLLEASLIVFIGLLASANLKTLIGAS